MKKTVISGVLLGTFLLAGCSGTLESEQEIIVSKERSDSGVGIFIGELENEIIASIEEQTELESDSLTMMIGSGAEELTVSIGYPKDSETEDSLIQQIVENSIMNVSEEAMGEETIEMTVKTKIEKY